MHRRPDPGARIALGIQTGARSMALGHTASKPLSSWGDAPCPLVPAALREISGDTPAPTALEPVIGRPVKLADLDASIWPPGETRLGKAGCAALVKVLTPLLHAHESLRIVGGDTASAVELDALPLTPQTRKHVAAALQGAPLAPTSLTFADLLAMPQVGPRRAIEIACALEACLGEPEAAAVPATVPAPDAHPEETIACDGVPPGFERPLASPPPLDETLVGTVVLPPGERREGDRRKAGHTPREIKTFFRVLAAWASGERGEQTLKNALPQPKPGWPPELVQLWKRVRYCSAEELAGNLRDRYSVPDLVQQAFAGCDQRHRLILQARVLTTTRPTSLEALATALCKPVDDVRELQREALGYLERLQGKPFRPVSGRASLIRQRLGCAVPERDSVLRQALDWAVSDFTEFPDLEFARELMLWLAGPYRLKERWFVTSADLPTRTVQALLEQRNRDGVIEMDVVRKVLSNLAIHPKYHEAWIDRIGEFIGVGNGLMCAADRVTGRLPTMTPP
jgi:hypothetical protein